MHQRQQDQDYRIEALPVNEENLGRVKKGWRQLTNSFPHSYFLSWGWMESWLSSQQSNANLRCVFGYKEGAVCFGFFVGYQDYRKFGMFPTRAAHINATGIAELDAITIEYNAILGINPSAIQLSELLSSPPLSRCNEFVFPGFTDEFASTVDEHAQAYYLFSNEQLSYYTHLDQVREKGGDFLSLLSSNKRQQIRRSIKEYEKGGPIQRREAQSAEEATAMFEKMGELHSKGWRDRGKQGSFANPCWVDFHKTLIRNRHGSGEIHITEIFTDSTVLGYIYGFVYQNKFYFCQCGFNYQKNNKLRPGMISHVLLIQHFAEQGLQIYDFLAGDSDYKRSLATHCISIYWLSLLRRTRRFQLAMGLKKLAYAAYKVAGKQAPIHSAPDTQA